MSIKRKDYISWDEFFMGVAILAAQRSKDPNTQVGSCIVNKENKIIGVGYNGMPCGCSDDDFPWERSGISPLNTKYAFVVHAEENSVLNCFDLKELKGSTIYCTLFPCNECAKTIVQSGIKKVIYLEDKYDGDDYNLIAKKIFCATGVVFEKFKSTKETINLVLKK